MLFSQKDDTYGIDLILMHKSLVKSLLALSVTANSTPRPSAMPAQVMNLYQGGFHEGAPSQTHKQACIQSLLPSGKKA